MSFLENTRSPAGLGGKLMVRMMNVGHRALARWGLRFLPLSADAKVLDCGCGGGANIRTLLKKCPQGIVKGVDISDVSVTTARRVNRSAIADGRCAVWQGSVDELIFAADWFDAVTAFETVYFWPDLPKKLPRDPPRAAPRRHASHLQRMQRRRARGRGVDKKDRRHADLPRRRAAAAAGASRLPQDPDP